MKVTTLIITNLNTVIQAVVIFFLLHHTVRKIGINIESPHRVFFAFALTAFFVSDVYWIVFDFMVTGTRMPLAANEVAESAGFLLLAAMITSLFRGRPVRALRATVITVLFSAANVAFWIGWSGEWIQDIVGGVFMAWFMVVTIRAMKSTDVLSQWKWYLFGIFCAALVVVQTLYFFVPDTQKSVCEWIGYVLAFAVQIILIVRFFRLYARKADGLTLIPLSCCCFGWSALTMYMSAGWFYSAAEYLSTLTFVMMFFAVIKHVPAGKEAGAE